MECGVWSVECGVWSVKCGVWSVGCGVWDVECGVWDVECGMWSVECGMWSVWDVECVVWGSVGCGVWSVECEMWSGCGVGRGVWRGWVWSVNQCIQSSVSLKNPSQPPTHKQFALWVLLMRAKIGICCLDFSHHKPLLTLGLGSHRNTTAFSKLPPQLAFATSLHAHRFSGSAETTASGTLPRADLATRLLGSQRRLVWGLVDFFC